MKTLDLQGPCVLAETENIARTRRRLLVKKRGRVSSVPHGFKAAPACGNLLCYAPDHIHLVPWAMWGRKRC